MGPDDGSRPTVYSDGVDDRESTAALRDAADPASPATVSEHISLEIRGRTALITVNDPDRRNAITPQVSAALRDAVHRAEADNRVHALIVTGAGSAFCAGADRTVLKTANEDQLGQIYEGFLAVANCILPTIAAVNGPAVGAGLNLALACDVRIAGSRAVFDPRFLILGVHPGGGATWMLQRTIGPALARAALLFGMKFDARSAVQHGLALTVAEDPVAAAYDLAASAASAPRDLVIATKATMRATISPGYTDVEQHAAAVAIEIGPQARSIQSAHFSDRGSAASPRSASCSPSAGVP